jgi:hypothetical protein
VIDGDIGLSPPSFTFKPRVRIFQIVDSFAFEGSGDWKDR